MDLVCLELNTVSISILYSCGLRSSKLRTSVKNSSKKYGHRRVTPILVAKLFLITGKVGHSYITVDYRRNQGVLIQNFWTFGDHHGSSSISTRPQQQHHSIFLANPVAIHSLLFSSISHHLHIPMFQPLTLVKTADMRYLTRF